MHVDDARHARDARPKALERHRRRDALQEDERRRLDERERAREDCEGERPSQRSGLEARRGRHERDALMMVMTSEMPGSVYMRHE